VQGQTVCMQINNCCQASWDLPAEAFFCLIFGLCNTGDVVIFKQRRILKTQEQLRNGYDVFFTIFHNSAKAILLPVNPRHIGTGDVIFRGGNAHDVGEQFKGGVMLVVAKFPQLHRVEMTDFPGLFSGNIKQTRQFHPIDNHATGRVGEVKFLAVVGAQHMTICIVMAIEKFSEGFEQFLFIGLTKGFYSELRHAIRAAERAHRDADDPAKLGKDTCLFIDISTGEFSLLHVQTFPVPEPLQRFAELIVVLHNGNSFNIEAKNIFGVDIFKHASLPFK